jgi:hypothetical protein
VSTDDLIDAVGAIPAYKKRGLDFWSKPLRFSMVEVIGIDNATAMLTEGQ